MKRLRQRPILINDEEVVQIHKSLSDTEKELMKSFVFKIVDTTLHHLLWTLEQEESLELIVNDGCFSKKTDIKMHELGDTFPSSIL